MHITKFGHSCVLIEEQSAKILIDPGVYSHGHEERTGLDAVLITHEHPDHCSVDSLYKIMANNPQATVITNSGTAEVVKKAGIPYRILDAGQSTTVKDVTVEGFGTDHNIIHSSIPIIRNTGYLIANTFFHPGDSYTVPDKAVTILALPTGGPWLKIGEAIDFALKVHPRIAFPIHDAMFKFPEFGHKWPGQILTTASDTQWDIIEDGQTKEF